MDVVRTNIEAIGGSVDVQTVLGAGTTFKVKIPLTLAIIPALLVTCGGDRYAIPQVSLLELVRLDGLSAESGIEWIQGVPVHRLRGRLLPLVFLDQVFGDRVVGDRVVGEDVVGAPSAGQRDSVNIVVVQADDHEFGLVVDEISDTAEIVVKPLGRLLKHVSAFAGATIMGDGRVALILDVLGIADHVGLSSSHRGALGRSAAGDETAAAGSDRLQRLLLCGVGDRRFALLLSAVARLEEFAPGDVETASHRPVVQYRGEILNLVDLGAELGVAVRRTPDQPMQVVVYNESARTVGLIVDEIFDIVEESLELSSQATAHGIAGSAIVQGAVIDVVDLDAVLRTALPPVTTRVEVAA
jgi:two-component system chemotaxis sensor kinase CheA